MSSLETSQAAGLLRVADPESRRRSPEAIEAERARRADDRAQNARRYDALMGNLFGHLRASAEIRPAPMAPRLVVAIEQAFEPSTLAQLIDDAPELASTADAIRRHREGLLALLGEGERWKADQGDARGLRPIAEALRQIAALDL